MSSNKTFTKVLTLTLATSLLAPVVSFAQTTPGANVTPSKLFCSKIDQVVAPIDQRFAEREAKLQAKRQETADNLTKKISDRDAHLAEVRATADANRKAEYAKLEARATTDAQKQAVAAFEATTDAAIAARKAAVDSAISMLRQNVAQAIATRKAAVDTATNTFKTAKTAAIQKAKTDCAAGVDAKTVRDTFKASMKTAQNKLKSDYQAIDKVKGSFETIRTEKKQALDKAFADFKTTMEKARTDLKLAFQQQ